MGLRAKPCPVGCNGKRNYRTRWQAERVARRMQRKDGDRMTWYRCSFGGYHVGHERPGDSARRQELKKHSRKTRRRDKVKTGQPEPSIRGVKNHDRTRSYGRGNDYIEDYD